MTIAATQRWPQGGLRPPQSPPCRGGRRRVTLRSRLIATVFAMASASAVAQQWQAHVSASTDYVVHGVSRSQGDPTLQGQLGADLGSGWTAGTSAATMNLNPGRGPNRELALYLSRATTVNRDWTLAGTLATYLFSPQIPGLNYDYSDARFELSWRERLQLGVAISPDYSVGTRRGVARDSTSIDYTLTISQPLTNSVELSAGLGQFDLSDGLGLRFWYWSAGAVYTGRRASVALTWTGAEPITRNMFSRASTGDRLIATVSWRLH